MSEFSKIPLKLLTRIERRNVDPLDMEGGSVLLHSIPGFDASATPETVDTKEIKSAKTYVETASVIISLLNPRISRVERAEGGVYCSTEFAVVTPGKDMELDFLKFVLQTSDLRNWLMMHAEGATKSRDRVGREVLGSAAVPLVNLETQRRIADYLDDEVREIDALIAELSELIENLELRRAAKTDALVKASRCDDLPLGIIADIKIGKMLAASPGEEGKDLPYLRAAHIQPAGLLDLSVEEKRMEFSSAEREAFSLRKGDILIVEGGAGYGRSVLLSQDFPNMGFQNSVNRVRVKESMVDPKFVYYMLQSAKMNGRIEMVCDTATIPHFTSEKVSRFRIPVPSFEKQREIADELDRETAEMDFLIKEATELIENLKARKTALITEVVTGRKKV